MVVREQAEFCKMKPNPSNNFFIKPLAANYYPCDKIYPINFNSLYETDLNTEITEGGDFSDFNRSRYHNCKYFSNMADEGKGFCKRTKMINVNKTTQNVIFL